MVKGVGLDAGEYEVKVVELDGSYKRPKLVHASVDRVTHISAQADDPEHASEEAEALRYAIKSAGVSKQNVALGFPCREAILRRITVPFTGVDRIRKMIKFEAESEIHSASVDDMVVDFHVVDEIDEETEVLVAGVPKLSLRTTLDALENAGVEPEKVDLDTMALYRLADWAGALTPGDADDADEAVAAAGRSRILLDIGARAVRVLVFTDHRLMDMRAIPTGGDGIAESLVQSAGLSLDQARAAVLHCLTTGEDYDPSAAYQELDEDLAADDEFAVDEDDGEGETEAEASGEVVAVAEVVTTAQVEAARDRLLQRLRREFMRFLVAVRGMETIEATIVTGAASRIPGVMELVADVFGAEPEPLQYLHLLNHSLDEDEATELEPRLAVAMGLALGSLGGVPGFNFRQEDLVYTRGFDRIKLPLAIACMLCLFFLCFHGLRLKKQVDNREYEYGAPRVLGNPQKKGRGGTVKHGFSGYIGEMFGGTAGRFTVDGKSFVMDRKDYRQLVDELRNPDKPKFNRAVRALSFMRRYLRRVQSQGDYDPTLQLDSGAAVLQEFGQLILSLQQSLGRFYVCELDVSVPRKGNRNIKVKIFFRGSATDFAQANQLFKRRVETLAASPESVFAGIPTSKETPQPGEGDDRGAYYDYVITLKDAVPVLQGVAK